ncbi:MAG: hypothetical protein Q9162_005180 [Coniocarpon cinnabarinum]
MSQTQTITNHNHTDMIHDAQLDYYGRRLATCSSDKSIHLFDVDPTSNSHTLSSTLKGHDAPVFALAWAHPKYGSILASSSYDGKVVIWRETPSSGAGGPQWTRLVDFALHTASVNSIAWSPHELGAHLACASSDGSVSVLSFNDTPSTAQPPQSAWSTAIIPAHPIAANAVSWAPSLLPGTLERAATPGAASTHGERRFVSGGSDGSLKLWGYSHSTGNYDLITELKGHSDWVRDVAWSPSLLSKTYIASGSQDKTVRIWTYHGDAGDMSKAEAWQSSELKFECVIWRVSWSLTGNVLAVSGGDNKVTLWKERVRDGGWECVRTMEE